jgi:very-short-patch-repair endonuclease
MRLDKALLDLAAEQRSCVADWQVREMGGTRQELWRLRSSKLWTPVGSRVLVLAGVPHDELVLASAAVLAAGPGAVLSHGSAASHWGVPGFRLLPAAVSQVSGHATRRQRLGYVHDLVEVPARWVTKLNGVAIVRPELAAYQVAGEVHPLKAERTFDAFAVRGLLSGASAAACLEDLQRRGRNGTVLYRDIIKARGNDYARPASNVESRMKQLGEVAGIKLRRQVNLGGDSFDGRVDFYEDDAKIVFEVLSEMYHWALCDREADAIRRKKLESDGFRVCDLWDTDIWSRGEWVTATMRREIKSAKSHSGVYKSVDA